LTLFLFLSIFNFKVKYTHQGSKKGTIMASIIKEITIAAPPKCVYRALTQQDEIAQWWTDDLNIKPEVGFLAEFSFQKWGAGILQFEIVKLEDGENVSWISRKGPPDWLGTNVTWQLNSIHNRTRLVFIHDGFTQVNALYEDSRGNWEYFLGSLKSYLETGKGNPGAPPYVK
jgi:uncharacterized protein YndB with AHSA1/START domain